MQFKTLNFKTLNSTNDKAISLLKKKNTKPTIIICDFQKKGRGRYGKKWITLKENLFMSIFFETKKKFENKYFTQKNCLIVKNSLSKLIKGIKIKKPNDLLVQRKKICGIMQEFIRINKKNYVIIGIGVNIKNSPNIPNYQTGYIQEFTRKNVNKTIVYKLIKKNFEKNY